MNFMTLALNIKIHFKSFFIVRKTQTLPAANKEDEKKNESKIKYLTFRISSLSFFVSFWNEIKKFSFDNIKHSNMCEKFNKLSRIRKKDLWRKLSPCK